MKSRAERLQELLLEYAYPETYCGKKRCEKCKKTKDFMDEFKEKIIALFKECAPGGFKSSKSSWERGFNSCKSKTLKNIEEMGK